MSVTPAIVGRGRPYRFDPFDRAVRFDADGRPLPPGWVPAGRWSANTVLKGWGGVVGPLLAGLAAARPVTHVYFEFDNAPGVAAAPGYDRTAASGAAYYAGLGATPTRDYVRAPVLAAAVDQVSPDAPAGDLVRIFAETAAAAGVHGKPFDAGSASRVFGFALASERDPLDPTQDVVMTRLYLAGADQILRPAAGGVAAQYQLTLG